MWGNSPSQHEVLVWRPDFWELQDRDRPGKAGHLETLSRKLPAPLLAPKLPM